MPNSLHHPAADRGTYPLAAFRSALDALDGAIHPAEARQKVAEGAARLTGSEGALLSLTEDGERQAATVFTAPGSERVGEERRETAVDLAEKALRLRHPVAAGRVAAAPLEWTNDLLGTLVVLRGAATPPFADADLTALSIYCSQAVVVLDNARLREDRLRARQEHNDFVSLVSHEFKTPLTAIKGFAQLVARRLGRNADEGLLEALRTIDSQATRLARLATDVTLCSRVESGRIKMEKRPGDLACLLNTCRAAVLPVAGRREVILDLSDDLPATAYDPDRLQQAVMNMLDNAVKYSPDGTPIRVTARRVDGAIRVSVQDRGIGLAAEEQRSAFRCFTRGDRAVALHEEGSGLGLAIARSIVAAHGGRIWVESEPDQGSTFSFTLPTLNPTS